MPFKIIRNDLTKMNTDAIVTSANPSLVPGGGVCTAVFKAAGYDALLTECGRIGKCKTGSAVITKGYALSARYIIHTVGPVYSDGNHGEPKLLYSCYKSSLKLAKKHKLNSIAFPLISSGIYGYPKAEALQIATKAIVDFLAKNEMDIYLVVYDKDSFEVSNKLFSDVKEYIDSNIIREEAYQSRLNEELYVKRIRDRLSGLDEADDMHAAYAKQDYSSTFAPYICNSRRAADLDSMLMNLDKSFSERLLELIDKSGMKDSEVYKKANVDRRLFSKIRSDMQYKPSKVTAVAFALALELDLEQTRDLLERAGYSMTHSNKFDIIIEYFITRKNYNIFEINEILFAFDQSLIGT